MTALTEVELDTRPAAGLAPDAQAEAGETPGRALRLLDVLPENQREVDIVNSSAGRSVKSLVVR